MKQEYKIDPLVSKVLTSALENVNKAHNEMSIISAVVLASVGLQYAQILSADNGVLVVELPEGPGVDPAQ